jgi:hypothetical protein
MYREWCIDQLAVAVGGKHGARLTGQLVGQLEFRTAPGRVRRLGQTRQFAVRGWGDKPASWQQNWAPNPRRRGGGCPGVPPDVPRDLRPFSNDQVHQISGVFPNWAPIYYVKTPCTDHPHTKEFPTSDNWHHIVLRAFLSPKCGR